MGQYHHCRAEKGEPSGAVQVPRCTSASAVLYKCLAVQKSDKLASRPRKLPGLIQITDHNH